MRLIFEPVDLVKSGPEHNKRCKEEEFALGFLFVVVWSLSLLFFALVANWDISCHLLLT